MTTDQRLYLATFQTLIEVNMQLTKEIKDLLEIYNDPKNNSKDREHYGNKIIKILNEIAVQKKQS